MERKKTSFFVKLAILFAVVFCVVSIVELQFQYNEYKGERDELLAQIDDLQNQVDEKQNELDTPVDEDYIIRVAKEKLNLRLPEEIIFYNDLYEN